VDYEIVENNRKDKFDQHEFIGEQRVVWKTSEEVNDPRTGSAATPRFLAPQAPGLDAGEDRLPQLARWLTSPDNRAFAQAQANRIWFQLMGRGLVEPIDDFRVTNPPSHPELLDALAQELIASGYSLRHLVRQIMSSAVYQAQAIADEQHTMAAENYAGMLPRRLSAEQLLDAQCQVLGTVAKFNGYPPGTEARQLAGTQRVRPREQRASQDDRFLTLFGKPARTMSCECERSDDTTLSQAFQLISGASLHDRLVDPQNRIALRLAAGANDDALVDELFWTALSRPATTAERTAAVRQVQASASRAEGFQDLAWALLNAKEFIYRP
jgi:hypothetical protein